MPPRVACTAPGSLTDFLHLFFELQTPTSEDIWAHGHGEDVIWEFSTAVTMLHLSFVQLLEGFVRRDDLIKVDCLARISPLAVPFLLRRAYEWCEEGSGNEKGRGLEVFPFLARISLRCRLGGEGYPRV